jgi:lambda repressor-like predicted transcriptional regulator
MSRDMTAGWLDRLLIAVERDGRSLRKISSEAGLGPNFLQQMFKDRKEPGVEKLLAVLQVLGTASLLFVLTGRDFTRDDERFLRLVLDMKPAHRSAALAFLQTMKAPEETP